MLAVGGSSAMASGEYTSGPTIGTATVVRNRGVVWHGGARCSEGPLYCYSLTAVHSRQKRGRATGPKGPPVACSQAPQNSTKDRIQPGSQWGHPCICDQTRGRSIFGWWRLRAGAV